MYNDIKRSKLDIKDTKNVYYILRKYESNMIFLVEPDEYKKFLPIVFKTMEDLNYYIHSNYYEEDIMDFEIQFSYDVLPYFSGAILIEKDDPWIEMTVGDVENYKDYITSDLRRRKGRINSSHHQYKLRKNMAYIGFMCPDCYDYTIDKFKFGLSITEQNNDKFSLIKPKREIPPMGYVHGCPNCGGVDSLIAIDPNIIKVISILNKKGYKTKYCCEGHNCDSIPQAYIYFEKDFGSSPEEFKNAIIYDLPITWYFDLVSYKELNHLTIRSEYINHNEAMIDILNWALNLKCIINNKKEI